MDKIIAVTIVLLLVFVCITIIFGGIFFGITGFLNLFGVRYDSFSSLLLFILVYFLIGVLLDFISIALIRLATQNLVGKYKSFLTKMVIDCTFSWLAFHTADEIIDGINIQLKTEVLAVVFFYLVGLAFEDKGKKKLNREQKG